MSIFFDPTMIAAERGLDISLYRQGVLNSNVANLDTPGYTPKDVDFSSALANAFTPSAKVVRTHAKHLQGIGGAGDFETYTRPDRAPGLDKNSVDLDAQMGRVSQNAILYNATSRVVTKKLAMLRYAVSEGAG